MTAPPQSSGAGMHFIGSHISLTTRANLRYTGTLFSIDTANSTVALKNVRSLGTEDRMGPQGSVPASDQLFEYIIFRGPDILDLQIINAPQHPQMMTPNQPPMGQPPSQQGMMPSGAHMQYYPPPQYQGIAPHMGQGGQKGPGFGQQVSPQQGGHPGLHPQQSGQPQMQQSQQTHPGQPQMQGLGTQSANPPAQPNQNQRSQQRQASLAGRGPMENAQHPGTNGPPAKPNEQKTPVVASTSSQEIQGNVPKHMSSKKAAPRNQGTQKPAPKPNAWKQVDVGQKRATQVPRSWGPPPTTQHTKTKEAKPVAGEGSAQKTAEIKPSIATEEVNGTPKENGSSSLVSESAQDGSGVTGRGGSMARGRGRGRGRRGGGGGRGRFRQDRREGPGMTVPQEDFDFETMNEKFSKILTEPEAVEAEKEKDPAMMEKIAVKYDKKTSFFDELVLENQMPRQRISDAERRREDIETFGETGGFSHSRYGRGRGRGRGRRGGGYYGRGRGRGRGYGHYNRGVGGQADGRYGGGQTSQGVQSNAGTASS